MPRAALTATRSGLTRRCIGVYSATSQTSNSKQLAGPFDQPDGVYLAGLCRRRAGELPIIAVKTVVNKEEATKLVATYLRSLHVDETVTLTVFTDYTETHDFGWVFYYGDVNPLVSLDGNGPIIVDRNSGVLFETGTACPLSEYLKNFVETGNPNSYLGKVIVLNSVTDDARRIDAVMAIREYAKLSLGETKKCFEDCLDGDNPSIALQSVEDAETLGRRLTELGLVVSQYAEMR